MEIDYYKQMNISRDATQEQIKAAYRQLCKKLHPDKADSITRNLYRDTPISDKELKHHIKMEKQRMEKAFKELNTAYQVLCDPKARAYYDTHGQAENRSNISEEQLIKLSFINLFRQAVMSARIPEKDNIVNKMIELSNIEINKLTEKRSALLRAAKKITKIKKRLSGPADGVHIEIFKADFAQIRNELRVIKPQISLLISVKEVSEKYSYDIDESNQGCHSNFYRYTI